MSGAGRRAIIVVAVLALSLPALLAACGGAASPAPSATGSEGGVASGGSPGASAVPSPVVGVVIKVESAGLDKVSGFTLRTDAGQTLPMSIGVLENGAQVPPGHLAEHLATGAPIRVWFRPENGALVAYRIEDAG